MRGGAVEAATRAAEAVSKRALHGCYGVVVLAFVAVIAFAAGGW